MGKFEEFMAFMAKKRAEESVEEKSELGGVTTSDNKKTDEHLVSTVRMILSGCSDERLRNLEQTETFTRIAKNFIHANTEEDIRHFISHNIAIKKVNVLSR